jgi:hypothetical protein
LTQSGSALNAPASELRTIRMGGREPPPNLALDRRNSARFLMLLGATLIRTSWWSTEAARVSLD